MSHRKIILSFIILVALQKYMLFGENIIGEIVYKEGNVEMMRNGRVYYEEEINIGDDIENQDLFTTHEDGMLEAELTSHRCPDTTIKIAPNTIFSFEINKISGKNTTTIDMISGSITMKVKKLSASQAFKVVSDTATLGVRGTSFSVSSPPSGDILVTCNEGSVLITDEEGNSLTAKPGNVVEKRVGETFREIPVAVSSLSDFKRNWMAERIEVFKKNALQAIKAYSERYNRLYREFNDEYRALLSEGKIIQKWINEDRKHKIGSKMEVMREKKRIIGHIFKMRRILFMFERVYFRLVQLNQYYKEGYGRGMIDSGISSSAFFKRFNGERNELERKMAMIKYVFKLYAARNNGSVPIDAFSESMSSDSDFDTESDRDFFGDNNNF